MKLPLLRGERPSVPKLDPDKMREGLQAALGGDLVSVILYGSAATGEHAGKGSDYNLLVLARNLSPAALDRISPLCVKWVGQGNPAPLLFTEEELRESSDVFPIEFLDILDSRKVLCGKDPFAQVRISPVNLRTELERELRGKLLRLREKYLLTGGKPGPLEDLMTGSWSTFLALFKGALRLTGERPPLRKMDALRKLRERFEFDLGVFEAVEGLKRGEAPKGLDRKALFESYLGAVEALVGQINHFKVS